MEPSQVSLGPGLRGGGLSTAADQVFRAPGSAEGAARGHHVLTCAHVCAGRFCGLVQFPGCVRRKTLLQLLLLLCHPFPVVSVPPSGFHADAGASLDTGAGAPSRLGGAGHPLLQGLGGSWGRQRRCDSPPALGARVLPSLGKHAAPPLLSHTVCLGGGPGRPPTPGAAPSAGRLLGKALQMMQR